jgi:cold-inducible RNA-binding protein
MLINGNVSISERRAWLPFINAHLKKVSKKKMSKKLYIGGLSLATDDAALMEAFHVHGEITEAAVITNRNSGRSRGFAFVTFADTRAADRAIEAMHGTMLDGRTLDVDGASDHLRGDAGSAP